MSEKENDAASAKAEEPAAAEEPAKDEEPAKSEKSKKDEEPAKSEKSKKDEEPAKSEKSKKDDPPADNEANPAPKEDAGADATAALGAYTGAGLMNQEETSDRTVKRTPVRTEFCCCVCECSNVNTRGKTCCCCLPLKAGIILVGLIVWGIAFQQFLTAYFKFMNATLPWWYPFVDIIFFLPGFVGVCFFIGWFTLDCKRTRGTLTAGIIQSLVSYVLILIWHVVYLMMINKQDKLGHGYGENTEGYTWTSKKHTLYYELGWGVVAVVFFILALTAVRSYVNSYPEDDEEPAKEEKAQSEKAK